EHIEMLLVDQASLQCLPFLPGLLGHRRLYLLAFLSGQRWKRQGVKLLLVLAAENRLAHGCLLIYGQGNAKCVIGRYKFGEQHISERRSLPPAHVPQSCPSTHSEGGWLKAKGASEPSSFFTGAARPIAAGASGSYHMRASATLF